MVRVLLGVLLGLLLFAAVGWLVVERGAVDLRADQPPGRFERWAGRTLLNRTARRHARSSLAPSPEPKRLEEGLAHYRENCVTCHGAPGVQPSEIGQGLSPPPPPLDGPDAQERSDGELFAIISHGVRLTGMPAFSRTHTPDELWTLVTFVRHLPKLSDSERRALQPPAEEEEHHHVRGHDPAE